MDDELARKKRELEELNEMIAYKKSLVEVDPGQRTCIDYDHGRIAVPLTEYTPVRSILKKRPEGPEYHHRPPYDDPYYDRSYSPYQDRLYGDRYTSRPYGDHLYESRLYSEAPYLPSSSHRYTDRYDVYDEPYEERHFEQPYNRPYDPYGLVKRSQSPEPHRSSSPFQSGPAASTQPLAATSSSHPPFRPPSPMESPPRSPSPKRQSSPAERPPLDRFLDMLNKKADAEKKSEPVRVADDLLPHERALQDGKGFSRIVGFGQEPASSGLPLEGEKKEPCSKRSSVEIAGEESKTEPYDKIQSLLRTIGLKLSTGDMSKLAGRSQKEGYTPKALSAERETLSSPVEELRTHRPGSVESDQVQSPARSSSLEPIRRRKTAALQYEDFLDQQELEALKKAQQLQSLTKTMGSALSTSASPKPPPGPPPTHYQHPPPPLNWPPGITSQISPPQTSTSTTPATPAAHQPHQRLGNPPGPPPGPPPQRPAQPPPGPPPGPPPRRPAGQSPFPLPSNNAVLHFMGQSDPSPPCNSSSQPLTTSALTPPPSSTPAASGPTNDDSSSVISTTVARCLKVIETVKSLAVQPPAKQAKSVQFSLPTELPSVAAPQTSAETDDDVKTKQKEKVRAAVVDVVERFVGANQKDV